MNLVLCCSVSNNALLLVPWDGEFIISLPMIKGHTGYLANIAARIMKNYSNCQGKSVLNNGALGDSDVSIYVVADRLTHTIESPPRLHGPEGLVHQFIGGIHTQTRPAFCLRRQTPDLPRNPIYEAT